MLKYCFGDVDKYISEHTDLSSAVVSAAKAKNLHVATAESCTGGLVAGSITDVSGSSEIFEGGVVTYANRIKNKLIGVSQETLSEFGAVSPNTAAEMSEGVLKLMDSDISISITGIAGPCGGTPEKPVGLVYISVSSHSEKWKKMDENAFLDNKRYVGNSVKKINFDDGSCISRKIFECHFDGSRNMVRKKTVDVALFLLLIAILAY